MVFPSKTTPDAICAAAVDLVEREGEAALTLRRLAGTLGLAPNALYRYYASREVLVAAVADEAARRLVAAIKDDLVARDGEAGPLGLDPAARTRALAAIYAAFGEAHPALYETMIANRGEAEASMPKPLGHELLWELVTAMIEPLTGREEAPAVAITLWGLLHGLWSLQQANLLGGNKPASPIAFAVDTLIAGLARPR